ncbi:MAG: hypothetical protein QM723_16420 [Myxococcaceae bacterium]
MPFRPLKFLLILGVIFGFGSGFASIARHHRGECHGGWGGRGYYGEVQEAPVVPAAPVVQVPAAAPVQQQQQTAPGAQSAPVIVQAPVAQPAPVIVIVPPSNSSPTVVTTPSNNNVAPSPAPAKE